MEKHVDIDSAMALMGSDCLLGTPKSIFQQPSVKLTGFTAVRGRRRVSKKKRKGLR